MALVCNWLFKRALWLCFKIVDEMAWEGIKFIGKRLEGWRAKMQGWQDDEGGLRCTQRGAHGLCLFSTNQEVTHVTRSLARGKGKDESTKEAQGIISS